MVARKKKTAQPAGPPELVRKRANRKSTMRMGRTIGAERERMETANERKAAHEKARRRGRARLVTVSLVFIAMAASLVILYLLFFEREEGPLLTPIAKTTVYEPTIEIIDEDRGAVTEPSGSDGDAGTAGSGQITRRMWEYIGQAEADLKDLGYKPVKAVLPTGSIREVDIYLDGVPGFVKFWIDRDTAPSVEDADRMVKYLKEQGVGEWQYIDVRVAGKGFWK